MNDKLLVSNFSGGRTSAFLSRYLQISEFYKDYDKIFIYANTGKEREETLIFIDQCSKHWDMPIVWVQAKINPIKGKPTTFDQVPRFDLRNHKTYEDLNTLSKIPFRKVEDLQELSKKQLSLFGVDIDHEYDCMCKSN